MLPGILLDFLQALSENRTLQYIDLSWNHLMQNSDLTEVRGGQPPTEKVMAITEEQLKKELADAKAKRAKGLQLDPIEVQAFVVSMLT